MMLNLGFPGRIATRLLMMAEKHELVIHVWVEVQGNV
jgi:hypothetical protein